MAEEKAFPASVVLTATTGMVLQENFEGVQEFFEWVAGYPVWTHQLVRLSADLWQSWAEHPDYSRYVWQARPCKRDTLEATRAAVRAEFHRLCELACISPQGAVSFPRGCLGVRPREPVGELANMMGGTERIIPVITGD